MGYLTPCLIALVSLLLISGCGSSTPAELRLTEVQKAPENLATVKPGASVVFSSSSSGFLPVGEPSPLVIQLAPQYLEGKLEAEVIVPEGLVVTGEQYFSESFVWGDQVSREFVLSADSAGEYPLGIVVEVTTSTGRHEARAFTQRFYVGETSASKLAEAKIMSANPGDSADSSAEADSGLHYLKAQEEVYIAP